MRFYMAVNNADGRTEVRSTDVQRGESVTSVQVPDDAEVPEYLYVQSESGYQLALELHRNGSIKIGSWSVDGEYKTLVSSDMFSHCHETIFSKKEWNGSNVQFALNECPNCHQRFQFEETLDYHLEENGGCPPD